MLATAHDWSSCGWIGKPMKMYGGWYICRGASWEAQKPAGKAPGTGSRGIAASGLVTADMDEDAGSGLWSDALPGCDPVRLADEHVTRAVT